MFLALRAPPGKQAQPRALVSPRHCCARRGPTAPGPGPPPPPTDAAAPLASVSCTNSQPVRVAPGATVGFGDPPLPLAGFPGVPLSPPAATEQARRAGRAGGALAPTRLRPHTTAWASTEWSRSSHHSPCPLHAPHPGPQGRRCQGPICGHPSVLSQEPGPRAPILAALCLTGVGRWRGPHQWPWEPCREGSWTPGEESLGAGADAL